MATLYQLNIEGEELRLKLEKVNRDRNEANDYLSSLEAEKPQRPQRIALIQAELERYNALEEELLAKITNWTNRLREANIKKAEADEAKEQAALAAKAKAQEEAAKAKAAEETAKPTPPATEERTAKEKAESDRTTPVVDKPAPVPPEGGDNVTTAPTAEKPQQTQQTIAPDDKPPVSTTTTQQETNAAGNINANGMITPQSNILDRFASNTWSASVYLLSPVQYTELVRTKKKNVNGYNLLFQSGGAPNNVGGYQGALNTNYNAKTTADGGNQTVSPGGVDRGLSPDAGRNPAFTQDFYIDSISFENALPGKQTQTSHMISSLKFTVIEPANITLLDRIYAAVQDMVQTTSSKSKNVNYTATQYLMVIRWYGYDINGNLMAVGAADPKTGLTDPNAVVEKFIPFMIKKINWSVSNKLVSYEFDCAPVGQIIGGGTRRGTIPYDVQLTSRTVGELLSGNVMYYSGGPDGENPGNSTTTSATAQSTGGAGMQGNSETMRGQNTTVGSAMNAGPAPTKANAAATKNVLKQGLAGAMTEYSAKLVTDKKVYQRADVYEVIFADGAEDIKNASIVLPSKIAVQTNTPMDNTTDVNQQLNQDTGHLNITARNWSITAGMQMSQVIDLAIRESSYIYDQSLMIWDEASKKELPNPKADGKIMQWYNVTMQAVPLEYDEARNDFAYKIIYIISKYDIPNFESSYFPLGKFRGIHKRYPYWFTGENTAVLEYTANFNAAYNMTISGGPGKESFDAKLKKRQTSNGRDIIKYTYAPRSNQSSQGSDGPGNEASANAAEYLYAFADPGGTKLKIIGDPAWIQQGSLCGGADAASLSKQPFLPDGTISFDNSQVLFEIAWQRPEDYDLSTGLANPYARPGLTPGQPVQSNFYQATVINNEFKGGKFEQTITGVLYLLTLPDTKKPDNGSNAVAGFGKAYGEPTVQPQDDSANRSQDTATGQSNRTSAPVSGSPVATASGAAVITPQTSIAQSAMNQAGATFVTGTPMAPVFSNPNYSATAISGTSFAASVIAPADVIASATPPGPPTGSGVGPVNVLAGGARLVGTTVTNIATGLAGVPGIGSNAPLPLNTTLLNVSQRIQKMAKDS